MGQVIRMTHPIYNGEKELRVGQYSTVSVSIMYTLIHDKELALFLCVRQE
jgi:hypothetical protein